VKRGNGHYFPRSMNKILGSLISSKNITSEKMLVCYILCSESLVEVDRLGVKVEVEVIDKKFKVEAIDRNSRDQSTRG